MSKITKENLRLLLEVNTVDVKFVKGEPYIIIDGKELNPIQSFVDLSELYFKDIVGSDINIEWSMTVIVSFIINHGDKEIKETFYFTPAKPMFDCTQTTVEKINTHWYGMFCSKTKQEFEEHFYNVVLPVANFVYEKKQERIKFLEEKSNINFEVKL